MSSIIPPCGVEVRSRSSGGVHDHIWRQSSVRRISQPTAYAAVREPYRRGGTLRGARWSAAADRTPDTWGTSRDFARSALDSHPPPRPETSGTRAAGLVRSAGTESGVAPTRSVGLRLCHRTPYNASSNTRGCRRAPSVIVQSLRRAQAHRWRPSSVRPLSRPEVWFFRTAAEVVPGVNRAEPLWSRG